MIQSSATPRPHVIDLRARRELIASLEAQLAALHTEAAALDPDAKMADRHELHARYADYRARQWQKRAADLPIARPVATEVTP